MMVLEENNGRLTTTGQIAQGRQNDAPNKTMNGSEKTTTNTLQMMMIEPPQGLLAVAAENLRIHSKIRPSGTIFAVFRWVRAEAPASNVVRHSCLQGFSALPSTGLQQPTGEISARRQVWLVYPFRLAWPLAESWRPSN